jgi:CheY-like chemotaxis protein
VDDDPMFLDTLRLMFIRVKESVGWLHDPESAVAYLDEHPEVDIILSDLMMPTMSGWDLLEKIKEKHPLITFILYSGAPYAGDRKPEHAPDPDYMLEKPFETKKLMEIVSRVGRQRL